MAPRESRPAAMRCCDGLTLPPIMLRTCSITCVKAAWTLRSNSGPHRDNSLDKNV